MIINFFPQNENTAIDNLLLFPASILGKDIPQLYELMTAPASKILDRWLESEPLKATLATDSVIGAMISPNTPGSGYEIVLAIMRNKLALFFFTLNLHLHEDYFYVKTK